MKQQILDEIRRIAGEHDGRAPGKRGFERETGISEGAWSGVYWARWSDAIAEAGFVASSLQGKLDDSVLFERMANAMRYYGEVPTDRELRLFRRASEDSPDHRTIEKRFGGKAQFFERLREFSASNPRRRHPRDAAGR